MRKGRYNGKGGKERGNMIRGREKGEGKMGGNGEREKGGRMFV